VNTRSRENTHSAVGAPGPSDPFLLKSDFHGLASGVAQDRDAAVPLMLACMNPGFPKNTLKSNTCLDGRWLGSPTGERPAFLACRKR
jgi:hypothetical protein